MNSEDDFKLTPNDNGPAYFEIIQRFLIVLKEDGDEHTLGILNDIIIDVLEEFKTGVLH